MMTEHAASTPLSTTKPSRQRLFVLALGCVLAGGILAGCSGPGAPLPPRPAGESPGVDRAIAEDIEARWQRAGIGDTLGVVVTGGRAVLTGRATTPDRRLSAVQTAWQAAGVGSVVNEIQVSDQASLSDAAADLWISAQLRSDLLLDDDIESGNVTIETINGVIYLIGRARSEAEKGKMLRHAREIPRAREVVDHVVVR